MVQLPTPREVAMQGTFHKRRITEGLGEGSMGKVFATRAGGAEFRSKHSHKNPDMVVYAWNPAPSRLEQMEPWGLRASLFSQINESQVQEETLIQNRRWKTVIEDNSMLTSDLYSWAQVCTYTLTYTQTYICTHMHTHTYTHMHTHTYI